MKKLTLEEIRAKQAELQNLEAEAIKEQQAKLLLDVSPDWTEEQRLLCEFGNLTFQAWHSINFQQNSRQVEMTKFFNSPETKNLIQKIHKIKNS